MSLTSAIVFYAVIWAITFLIMNPLWQVSQGEAGEIVPGTPESAPVDAMVAKKALWTTVWASVAFAILYSVIVFEVVTLADVSWVTIPSLR